MSKSFSVDFFFFLYQLRRLVYTFLPSLHVFLSCEVNLRLEVFWSSTGSYCGSENAKTKQNRHYLVDHTEFLLCIQTLAINTLKLKKNLIVFQILTWKQDIV